MSDAIANHSKACTGLSEVVAEGERCWTNRSPCGAWDARDVLEHVIGFHDDLLLRPTGTERTHTNDDPVARWPVTVSAIASATELASLADAGDPSTPPDVDLDTLLPALTGEVLAHTWDLAKAIGVEPRLDLEPCGLSNDFLRANEEQVRSSGLFDSAVPISISADAASQFVAFIGLDPGWTPKEGPLLLEASYPALRCSGRRGAL